MRTAYGMIGIGTLVIVGGLYLINHHFTSSADTGHIVITSNGTATMPKALVLSSSEFLNDGLIPARYTCDGDQINPPLTIEDVSDDVKSLVLIVNDPDVPKQIKSDGNFDHWVLFNIPPTTAEIAAGTTAGTPGSNGAGKSEYAAPCPPKEYEPSEHRYFFKLYGLDSELSLKAGASRAEVENAMQGHVIAQAELVGTYKRR